MDDEEDGSKREELLRQRLAEMQKMQQAEAQLRSILRVAMEPEAYERFMNVRIANPELYAQIARIIVTLYSNKQLSGKVGDKELRALLAKLTAGRGGNTSIIRKRK
ncbi:MAG: hypothetical protein KAT35_03845 [Candidatus Aenigmarchaeota archaeon]|nr:hypothetical protein [Candidatus Aenigmarchaeota archaeon]